MAGDAAQEKRAGDDCRLGFIVDNLLEIAVAYGEAIAGRVLCALSRQIESLLPEHRFSVMIEPWGILVQTRPGDANIDPAIAETVLALACERPIQAGNTRINVALRVIDFADLSPRTMHLDVPARIAVERFRADMRTAAAVYDATSNGRLILSQQAVANAHNNDEMLYAECLARAFDRNGRMMNPGSFMSALERLHLTRAFDRHVVAMTIAHLGIRPDSVLGCNISVLSAVDDIWWMSIKEKLRREPAVASRLVIEITESALPENWATTRAFITVMQELGCRIALDDFGTGFSSIDFARSAGADIIKIDASFVFQAALNENQSSLLHHLVMLAGNLAPKVVIEGIESTRMREMAQATGAGWLQGYSIGRPETVP